MKKILCLGGILFAVFLLVISFFLFIQRDRLSSLEAAADNRSWFISFIERKLSTPNHQIRLNNVQGILFSKTSVDAITVSDHKGIWLKIVNAKIDWNRLALLKGHVQIDQLSAEYITFLRKPQDSSSISSSDSSRFSIPKLPIDISINTFVAEHINFEQDFFGLSSDVSLKGHVSLVNGDFNADITIDRLDAPGHFSILTKLLNSSRTAKINITADEPKNGILANILRVDKRPALNFVVTGNGTFDDLNIALRLEADHQPILNGNIVLASVSEGHRLFTELAGKIGFLTPAQYRSFFESDVALKAEAVMTKEGALRLDHMMIQGDVINVVANTEITADGFLRRLFVDGQIDLSKHGESVRLPMLKGKARADNLALTIDYGGEGQQAWKGQLHIHHLSTGNVHINDAVFDMGGVSKNLDDVASRHVGIHINGTLQGVVNSNDESADDSQTIYVKMDTDIFADKPVLVRDFSITAQDFSVWLKGEIDRFVFKGDLGLKAKTLAPFGFLSGQPFSGSADIEARGAINLTGSVFNLELSGTTDTVKMGVEAVDRFMQGNLVVSAAVIRNTKGVIIRHLHLENQRANVRANGHFSNLNAEMDFSAQISDLAILYPRLVGATTIKGAARGHNNFITISTHVDVSEALFVGKKLQNATLNINALIDNTSPAISYFNGLVKGEGTFAEKPLQLSVAFNNSDHLWKFQDIDIKGGYASITGNLARTLKGFMKGTLHIDADDISIISALILQEGSGDVKGDVVFDEQNGKQSVNLKANIDHLIFAKNEIKKLEIQANIFDPFGTIQFEGFVNAEQVQTPLIMVNHLNAHANGSHGQTAFHVQAMLHDDADAKLSGSIVTKGLPEGVKRKVQLETVNVEQSDFHATLLKPVTIIFNEDEVTMGKLGLAINEGKIVLAGNLQDTLNLQLTMDAIPVALANLWRPDLGADGTLTGTVLMNGHFEKPDVTYDIKGQGLTIAALREKKITPFVLSATGKMTDGILTVDSDLLGEGLQAQTQGTLALKNNKLDLHVHLKNLPAHFANGLMNNQTFGGVVTGKIDIRGTLKDPSAHFEFLGHDLIFYSTAHKRSVPVNMDARGSYEQSILHIDHLIATGSKELDFAVKGYVSLYDAGIGLSIKGTMPLVFIDQFLAERGAHITGTAEVDTTINGVLSQPQLVGQFSVTHGSFSDSQTNLGLRDITLEGKLNGDHMILERAHATSSSGGSISATGRISNDLQTDLVIKLNRANYNNGSILATLTGEMTVTGRVLHDDLVLGGDITVEKAEIFIPDHFRNNIFFNIKQKNLTKPIRKTLEYANVKIDSQNHNASEQDSSLIHLNMKIKANNQFFVRGRGLDAELGGYINLTGPLHDVYPVGELQMIRGRFDILSRRLSFDQGRVNFNGYLSPTVYFVTNSDNADVNVMVTVSGTIDNLDIKFTSQPVLPQDEVLARLIFNRSLSELSAFQIAQLATAVAELAGATNASLLSALRNKINLDDLDIVVDEKGNTGLRVGRYIHDNIYLGFETGPDGATKGTINLDISRRFKMKTAIGNEKNSSFGLFYEKDY
ncbi:translocation/assembly module TamB domain-containing protein [Bartonella bacilliformis]|uniref:translocation/assembly module TamB domain-containing protein n=1 Tax=Bartonella bacilliformis TaxID=774 RepID=UPI0004A04CF1|nr:translocation/assembly module TamB domain-containing protein [Bartonella bacilliformis]KEG21698.1 hypothetical protein H703_01214 [Bartonella bacilliformis Ver075]